MGKRIGNVKRHVDLAGKPSEVGARMSQVGRRAEGERCSYVMATGTPCVRRASAEGLCTLHVRRTQETGTQFYVEFAPLPGYQAEVVRRGPFRAAKANQIMADLERTAWGRNNGYAVRQVRAQ